MNTVERALAISFGNQPCHGGGSHHPSARLWLIFVVYGPCWTAFAQARVSEKPSCTSGGWHSHRTAHCGLLPANQVGRWTDNSTWCWPRCWILWRLQHSQIIQLSLIQGGRHKWQCSVIWFCAYDKRRLLCLNKWRFIAFYFFTVSNKCWSVIGTSYLLDLQNRTASALYIFYNF